MDICYKKGLFMIYTGNLTNHQNRHIAIIISRFNTLITEQLLRGAQETLKMHGVAEENVTIFWVPGAFEIPLVAKKIANTNQFDGIITLGAVIKGETSHYDLVINVAANGISNVSLETGVPCVFGVLTTDTLEQAQHRSGAKSENIGTDVTTSLLELLSMYDQINQL